MLSLPNWIGNPSIEIDPISSAIAFLSLCVSVYLAYQVKELSRKLALSEATRSIYASYAAFNAAMIADGNHEQYWRFMRSGVTRFRPDERVNHLIFLYLNSLYSEWDAMRSGLLGWSSPSFLRDTCELFAGGEEYVIDLVQRSGYEQAFAKELIAVLQTTIDARAGS